MLFAPLCWLCWLIAILTYAPLMKMEMMMKLTVSAAACLELCSTYSASGQVKVISQCCLRVKAEALIVFSLPAV